VKTLLLLIEECQTLLLFFQSQTCAPQISPIIRQGIQSADISKMNRVTLVKRSRKSPQNILEEVGVGSGEG
jgi:hypothetical protein